MYYFIVILCLLISLVLIFIFVIHLSFRPEKVTENKTPSDFGIKYQEQYIPGLMNKKLFSWLLISERNIGTIIMIHGWGGNSEFMLPLALPFYHAGFNVLLIDARGHGKSDPYMFPSLPRFAEDVDSARHWLHCKQPLLSNKLCLIGHSVGASAVLLAASKQYSDLNAVISIASFAHPELLMLRYLKEKYIPFTVIQIILKYIEKLIGSSFDGIAPINTVCEISAPVLLVHGKEDSTIPISDAYLIKDNCKLRKIYLLELDDTKHDSVEKINEHFPHIILFLQKCGYSIKL